MIIVGGQMSTESGRERELTAEPKYTAQVVFLTTPDQAARLEEIARVRRVSKATVGREALDIALPKLEAKARQAQRGEDPTPTDEVRHRRSA